MTQNNKPKRNVKLPKILALPRVVSAAELIADMQQIAPDEIVTGLIHQGTKVVLGGSSKAGKTWLLLDLALSVANGAKFLRWNTKKGRVLFLNFEIQSTFIRDRVQTLVKHRNYESTEGLDFWNLRGKAADFDALLKEIIEKCEENDYSMIILDPIYKLMVGKSEHMTSGVGSLCSKLERIAEGTGATVVYAHHFTKGNQSQKKAIDRLSGSGVFGRDADSIVLLTDHGTPNCFTVDLILRNLPPQESFVTEWQYPVMVEREDLEAEGGGEQDDARAHEMLNLLATGPMTTGQWEAAAKSQGIPRASFFRTKRKLKDSGLIIQNPKDKKWSVTVTVVTSDTGDTNDTGKFTVNSGGITGIKESHKDGPAERKLLGWSGGDGEVLEVEVVA